MLPGGTASTSLPRRRGCRHCPCGVSGRCRQVVRVGPADAGIFGIVGIRHPISIDRTGDHCIEGLVAEGQLKSVAHNGVGVEVGPLRLKLDADGVETDMSQLMDLARSCEGVQQQSLLRQDRAVGNVSQDAVGEDRRVVGLVHLRIVYRICLLLPGGKRKKQTSSKSV